MIQLKKSLVSLLLVGFALLLGGCGTTGGNRVMIGGGQVMHQQQGQHYVPSPPMVLHQGRLVPQGSPGTAGGMMGNYRGQQFAIPQNAQFGVPFQTVIGGRQIKMVCSLPDRAMSGGLNAVIGGLAGLALSGGGRSSNTEGLIIAGAAAGGAYGLSDFGCKPEMYNDGDTPQMVQGQSGRQGGNTIVGMKRGEIPASAPAQNGKDLWKWRHHDATEENPKPCFFERNLAKSEIPAFCSEAITIPRGGESLQQWYLKAEKRAFGAQ